ncbi:MAG: peptidoglycan DD-metalloendopeptidase family protein [Clostridia bacterium]|nr:peptidoglycan DD-metalloendopeptidase family protein [Clostridia bacterium]
MKKKVLALALAIVLSIPVMVSVDRDVAYAATVQEKINAATKEKQEALDKIKDAEKAKDDVVAQSEQLEREIDLIQSEIYAIDDIIAQIDAEIAEKEAEIAQFEADIAAQDEKLKACLRAMDENSMTSYLDLLLSSESFAELLINIETINEMTEYDMAIIQEMTDLKTEVEAAKAAIEAKRKTQEEARAVAADKQGDLEVKLAEKEALAKALEKDIEKYKQVYEEARRQEEALKKSIAGSLSTSSNSTYTGNGQFCWPAPSYTRISSPYGWRLHPIYKTNKFHSGVDLAAPGGSNILAAESGTVKFSGWNGGYGNCLIIDHGGGITTLYGHASKLCVSKGQYVSKGEVVAKVGTTGNSTGNHLHFEVLINGKTTDPMTYIR